MAIKLGELLVRANVISDSQLKAALTEQQKWGGKLGAILVRMDYCSEELIIRALSKQLGLQRVDLDRMTEVPQSVLDRVPAKMARDLDVMPLQVRDDGKTLVVALSDPLNIETLDALRARSGCRIVPLLAGSTSLNRARARFYYGEEELSPGGSDERLDLTDALGRTVAASEAPAPRAPAPPPPTPAQPTPAPPAPAAPGPTEMLNSIEAVQRREVAAIKVLVELLVEKGVFGREEYLARVKR